MESNKQVLEAANAAITKGDYEGFLSYCTEDTEGENKVGVIFAEADGDQVKWATQDELEGGFVQQVGELIIQHNSNEKPSTMTYNLFDSGFRDITECTSNGGWV